jgi:bla regulator protein blaR1
MLQPCLAALVLMVAATAQTPPKVFDISTVKPNAANDNRVMLQIQPGGRFNATGVTLKMLMTEAYNVRDFQISGGPGWMDTERWDIVAKAEGVEGQLPIDELRPMLRVLLEERFQLKVRRETREMPVYALVVGKSGSKLVATSGESGKGPQIRFGRGSFDAKKIPIKMLLQPLGQMLGRPVIDKTDLTGEYDIHLTWTPEQGQGAPIAGHVPPANGPGDAVASDPGGPSIFTAVQEQLGLRLDSSKAPAETILIDHVEKPAEN